jgi:hypothetical protein
MTHHILSSSAYLLLALLVLGSPVHAQEWQQEVQIITTVRPGDPTTVLLDSLDAVFERTPDVRLRRSAQDLAGSYDEHLDALLTDGVDLKSASHAFIRYRFSLDNQTSKIVESIEDIYFVSRFDENYSDLPILYVSAQDPIVSDIIVNQGVPNIVNLKSITTFRELLAFPLLQKRQETAMVELAGRALRGEYMSQREALLKFLDDHMNLGSGAYVLTTPYEEMVETATDETAAASLQ